MEACSLLLGRPWEYDRDAAHHGRTNTYTFMHKDKNITLLPVSPTDVRKHFRDLAANDKTKAAPSKSSDVKHDAIKLKGGTFIVTTSAVAELCDNPDAPCYTMLCHDMSFFNDPLSCTLHPVAPNLLQEIVHVGRESRMTPI